MEPIDISASILMDDGIGEIEESLWKGEPEAVIEYSLVCQLPLSRMLC